MQSKSVRLFYKQDGSDKVYQLQLEPKNDGLVNGWVVNFQYGRRGSSLQSGTKTPKPVSYEKAETIFKKLLTEKTQKGYTPDESGVPYVASEKEERVSGLIPQLLNSIEEEKLESYFKDLSYLMQEKKDGKRILLRRDGDQVEAINRKGLVVGFPEVWEEEAKRVPCDRFVLDGEAINDVLHCFDVPQLEGRPLLKPYLDRHFVLRGLLESREPVLRHLLSVETFLNAADKRKAFAKFKKERREGVVFKNTNSLYTPGRPNSGGPQVKFKFVATCSAVVFEEVVGKRSVRLSVRDNEGRDTDIGKVTILPNFRVPKPGAIVEVQYLYAYPGGALYQPVYLGERDDISVEDCLITQLKYKVISEEDEA